MKRTVGKLFRDYKSNLHQTDHEVVDEFIHNPRRFLDSDFELALDLKKLYEKRKLQVKERAQMGVTHLHNVTPEDLKKAGVSFREYDQMKKLMDLDPEIFIERYEVMVKSPTPYTYAVDLSKYENQKIP